MKKNVELTEAEKQIIAEYEQDLLGADMSAGEPGNVDVDSIE